MKIKQVIYVVLLISNLTGCTKNHQKIGESYINLDTNWVFRQVGNNEWLPARVPGCVHTDLLNNKLIDDPFYRLNEHNQQWIDKADWEYQTHFEVSQNILQMDKIELNFQGLDTHADVYINDSLVLKANNMFREWKVDIKNKLKPGKNNLRVLFHSPIAYGLEKFNQQGYEIPVSNNDLSEIGQVGNKRVSVYSRKAPYHFGWDWGPRLVTSGIWRPVSIHAWSGPTITDMQIYQVSLDSSLARLNIKTTIESTVKTTSEAIVVVNGEKTSSCKIKIHDGENHIELPVSITNPNLWWPNGYGKPYLYNIELQIYQQQQMVASVKHRIGLRNLEVVQEKDSAGTSFYFKINGSPIFMKGANYIPLDIFAPRVTHDQYEHLVSTAASCNMNMLRVWGGGIYENNEFYDLCDEMGILIWHDFMFACNMYPGDSAFLKNVEQEAIDNVKRIRNHPCIALWCGNNEMLSAWMNWGYQKQVEDRYGKAIADSVWKAYDDVFHHILPGVVSQIDPDRYYHSSSPSAGFGVKESFTAGDIHYWGVWWGKESFSTYRSVKSRFFSEYGFQSFPAYSSVQKYTMPDDYNIYSPVMNSHQRSTIGNVTIEEYLLRDYRKPKDFQTFLYMSQLLQAEGIKTAIKLHRKSKPYTMGSLYWQINDCWPVASWSSMDYYGQWKALQYFSKKAFREMIVSADNDNNLTTINVISDRLAAAQLKLKLTLMNLKGHIIWETTKPITIKENGNIQPYYMATSKVLDGSNPKEVMLLIELYEGDNIVDDDIQYFVPVKDLNLPKPVVKKKVTVTPKGFAIELSSDVLVKNIFLSADSLNFDGFFSDNYFDMVPGRKYSVDFVISKTKNNFELQLKMLSVYDSY